MIERQFISKLYYTVNLQFLNARMFSIVAADKQGGKYFKYFMPFRDQT